jgi:hypothetical protein
MNLRLILILSALLPTLAFGQRDKFQINGAARAYYFANELNIDETLDSVTTRKANYGHTLLDLGVSVFPNDQTEVIGMFRIRNELGGFWGGGVSFNVRQLTLRGVAGGVVKYEIGDIDLKMTPYTLWNFSEEGAVNEADVFSIRRDVVHYDMFYNDQNFWRMQGANTSFGLTFGKLIDEINVRGFITRQRATDGISLPERLYGGGSLNIVQSDYLQVTGNTVNIFDLTETIEDSLQYKNSVHTANLDYSRAVGENDLAGFVTEAGVSSSQYINYKDERAPESREDWFYDAALYSTINAKGLKVKIGYKDVGADFRSPGAQTRRVNFSRFPGLFQQYTNESIGRPANYADVISGNTENGFRISEQLTPYSAALNNTNPYGMATPNRRGFYLNAERTDSVGFRKSFASVAMLTESRGTGTLEKKKFMLIEAGTDIYVNDFIGSEKAIKIGLGVRLEQTTRGGEYFESINLSSVFIDAGLAWEFVDDLDVLMGAKLWSVSGNAFVDERNAFSDVDDYEIVDFDFSQNTYAFGMRYRFSETNIISAHYQIFNADNADEALIDYGISQFSILFNLMF